MTSIQIIRLLSHARRALSSYEKVDANYRVFRHSILSGFRISNFGSPSSVPSKFLGLDGLIHFSKKAKDNLSNIQPIGGFSPDEMIARSGDIANQIILLNYMMKDRTVLSCTEPNKQLETPVATEGAGSALYLNALKEITEVSKASYLIFMHDKSAEAIVSNEAAYLRVLDRFIESMQI